ncbi:MAG: hypothetical protein ABSF70_18400 [Terracidiphilus sp.]|jgi:hypothetical protein
MKSLLRNLIVVMGLALGISSVANALVFGRHVGPEIDPSLAVGALTLLAGSLAVLNVRRKK